jgi:hypothetical protein
LMTLSLCTFAIRTVQFILSQSLGDGAISPF